MKDLHIKIKGLRLKKGLSQDEMATKLGMSQSNYGRIEKGQNELKIETLTNIAKSLDMSLGSLIDYDEREGQTEDIRYYIDELKSAHSKIERLKKDSRDKEDSEELFTGMRVKSEEKLKEKNSILNESLKKAKEEIERNKLNYEVLIAEKDKQLNEKDERLLEKERTIQILQKLLDKM